MKIACVSFTDKGQILGERLSKLSNGNYTIDHYINSQVNGGIKSILKKLWNDYEGIVFISATGIAIRLITPYIKDKTIDPAIIVIDDMSNFVISLLSGHIGGANSLAKWLGEKTGAIPVITTATDNRDIEAIDIFAKKNNYYMEDMESIKKLTSMMVNGKKIGLYSNNNKVIQYNNLVVLDSLDDLNRDIEGLIIVGSEKLQSKNKEVPYTILRPKEINIGIGCRKGVEGNRIIEAIKEALSQVNLSPNSIKTIGTVEVKKDEKGIIEAAKYFNSPLKIFTIDEIKIVEDKFEKSDFVKHTIGVYSVSEPVAYLLGGELITRKSKHNGITISISK